MRVGNQSSGTLVSTSGARRFLELYSVLKSSVPTDHNLRPLSTNSGQAILNESTVVAFLWGDGEKLSASLIAAGINALNNTADQTYERGILLLVDTRDAPPPERLANLVAANQQSITIPSDDHGDERETTVTETSLATDYLALNDNRVWDLVSAAPTTESLRQDVARLVGLEEP